MTEQIQQLFSSIAPKYNLLNTLLSLGRDRGWRRTAVYYLKECRKVLDLCAGTLALTKELLTVNRGCQITAVDFSKEMLEEGIRSVGAIHESPLRQQIQTECVDFYQFERPPFSFDAAMCAYGMRNLDDNRAALQKIHQLLDNKGQLVILEFFRPNHWFMKFFHATYAQFVIPTIGRLISHHRGAYEHLRDSIRGFYTLDEYCRLLREAGFKVKVAKQLTGGISGLIVAEKTTSPIPLLNKEGAA